MFSLFNQQLFTVSVLVFLEMILMSTGHTTKLENIRLINENSSIILHPSMVDDIQNTTTSSNGGFETNNENYPWRCQCSNDLEENENESECHCEGPKLLKIPQILPTTITRLVIRNAKYKELREVGLRKYSSTLKDL